jgi:hypothetical protein
LGPRIASISTVVSKTGMGYLVGSRGMLRRRADDSSMRSRVLSDSGFSANRWRISSPVTLRGTYRKMSSDQDSPSLLTSLSRSNADSSSSIGWA